MSELRTRGQRKADVIAALEGNGHAWLATASRTGSPRLIAVTAVWDGEQFIVATRAPSPTARNLADVRRGRIAIGSPDDVVMVDVDLVEILPATADSDAAATFVRAAGWDPVDEGPDWQYFRLRPRRIEAYRGYGELPGRDVMRDGRWLA